MIPSTQTSNNTSSKSPSADASLRASLGAPPAPTLPAPVVMPAARARGKARPLFEPSIVRRAVVDSIRKLDPRHQIRNPVMFVVEVGSVLTTALFVQALLGKGEAPPGFIFAISLWLWFTVVFANFAEAMAEGRGKAQAESL